jgi:hypothetical protein
MTIEELRSALGWCIVIDYALLLFWFAVFVLARGWMHRLHTQWFTLSDERFDALHYGLMGAFKVGILLFHLAPYLALHVVA